MPFFPALPEPRPATVHPFSALMGGMGAATELKKANADAAIKREALIRSQKERQALEQFQQTGDPNVLTSVMTPQQAMVAKDAHTQAQIKTGLDIANYFDEMKLSMTWENYPKFRQDMRQKFPEQAERLLPPPEAIGSKENFEKWRIDKFEKLARFKAMPQVIAAQQRASRPLAVRPGGALVSPTGEVLHEQPAQPKEYAPVLVDTPQGPQWVRPGEPVPSGATGKTGVTQKVSPATREELAEYQKDITLGNAQPGGFITWRNKKAAEKAGAVQTAKEETPGGELKKAGTKARTQVSEGKAEEGEIKRKLLKKLTPGGAAGEKPTTYTNPKTGETISAEEYERRKAAAGAK